tara:strand:+ start:1018 stop:3018 length:2001 start_codon:yes stop_codon:yes gene_type:complete
MALRELKSDLSWYGRKPIDGPYRPPTSTKDTRFNEGGKSAIVPYVKTGGYTSQGVSTLAPAIRYANDSFIIDDVTYSTRGGASRRAQLGDGFPFPSGEHKFDITRTGFHEANKYADSYGTSHGNAGLANTYTANSPIDDMYNKFNLREDAPNPAWAKQPFILRGIQRNKKTKNQRWGLGDTIAGKISSTFDIPRGGILTAGERAIVDVVRIGKFLISPRGLGFMARQIGYQLMNPKKETRLWNPLSLGSVVPLIHINRHIGGGIAEKLLKLGDAEDLHERLRKDLFSSFDKDNDNNKIEIGSEIKAVSSKLGGPESILGIGGTSIFRDTDTSLKTQLEGSTNSIGVGGIKINLPGGKKETDSVFDMHRWSYAKAYLKGRDSTESGVLSGRTADGQDQKDTKEDALKSTYTDWRIINRDRGGDGNALEGGGIAEMPNNTAAHTISKYKRMAYGDMPNRTPSTAPEHHDFRSKTSGNSNENVMAAEQRTDGAGAVKKLWEGDRKIDEIDLLEDEGLIKFVIGGINFKAYLDTLDDAFAPDWGSEQDQGRADPRYQYAGFERTVSTGFLVPILSSTMYDSTWNKLQDLARLTYPVYGSSGFYGQTVNVTIGDLFVDKPMIITDLGYSWDTETPWEISEGKQAPMYTTVSISFTVLGYKPTSGTTVFDNI